MAYTRRQKQRDLVPDKASRVVQTWDLEIARPGKEVENSKDRDQKRSKAKKGQESVGQMGGSSASWKKGNPYRKWGMPVP